MYLYIGNVIESGLLTNRYKFKPGGFLIWSTILMGRRRQFQQTNERRIFEPSLSVIGWDFVHCRSNMYRLLTVVRFMVIV